MVRDQNGTTAPSTGWKWKMMTLFLTMTMATATALCQLPWGSMAEARSEGDIVINEVLFDPSGSDVKGEFVEILNAGDVTIDLTDWTLTDNDGEGPDLIIPSFALASGSFLVVRTGQGINDTDISDGVATFFLGRSQGIWTNTGDDLLLSNGLGEPIDYIAYGDGVYIDPPPPGMGWSGTMTDIPEGYSLIRIPDGKDTDSSSDLCIGIPSPGSVNVIDRPPDILDFGMDPEEPNAHEDVLVWAEVVEDIELKEVVLKVDYRGGIIEQVKMVQNGSRHETVIEGQEGGTELTLTITAVDTGGLTNSTPPFNLTFITDITPTLSVDIRTPSSAVVPGGTFLITGEARWSNGTMANGTVVVTIITTAGEWTFDFDGPITLRVEAPETEGSYNTSVKVIAGNSNVTVHFDLEVEWPHEELRIEIQLMNTSVMTGQEIMFTGSAIFSDGIPASKARIEMSVVGTEIGSSTDTDRDGAFNVTMRAPAIAGNYTVEARSEFMGRDGLVTTTVDVQDSMTVSIEGYPSDPVGPGTVITITGRATHHDKGPVIGSLVIVEILNTTIKNKAYTDGDGRFDLDIWAPGFQGAHQLRVTVVSGSAIGSVWKTLVVQIEKKEDVPGYSLVPVLIAMVAALALFHRERER